MITHDIIKETALLCKLHIDNSELDNLTRDLQRIIDFADKISEVQLDNEIAEDNTVFDYALRNDEVIPSLNSSDILKNAPESDNGYFVLRGKM